MPIYNMNKRLCEAIKAIYAEPSVSNVYAVIRGLTEQEKKE